MSKEYVAELEGQWEANNSSLESCWVCGCTIYGKGISYFAYIIFDNEKIKQEPCVMSLCESCSNAADL